MLTRLVGADADQHPRHVGRHVPRPVQPDAAHASPRRGPAAALPDPGHAGPARADQAAVQGARHRRREVPAARSCSSSSRPRRKRACAPNAVEAGDDFTRRQVEHYALYEAHVQARRRRRFRRAAAAQLRAADAATKASASTIGAASRICWSTSSRTPTCCSTSGSSCWPGPNAAMFAVGDDDQSIYAFRGANVGQHAAFRARLRDAGPPVRLIKLEQNYRSHGHILDAANALIKNNATRLGKNLWTSEGEGEPVRAFAAPSDLDEAAFIVDVVKAPRRTTAWRSTRSRCSTAATRSRACSSTRCSTRRCRTASTAACASSSARR